MYKGQIITPHSIVINYSLDIPNSDMPKIYDQCNGNVNCMAKQIVSHDSFPFHVKPDGDDYVCLVSHETEN